MRYLICLFILCLTLATPLLSHAQDKPLCEQYTCVAQWNWGYQFGFGRSGSTPAAGSYILLENADTFALENDDKFVTE
jgi:hypothetical protein